jgi:uncharacterized protein YbaR (Trm112 family)
MVDIIYDTWQNVFFIYEVKNMKDNKISEDLLQILVCPKCKADIEYIEYAPDQFGLKCLKCQKIYPVKDGIPVMLIDEAIECPG